MKKYFVALLVLLLVFSQIHNYQSRTTVSNEKTIIASLLDSSPSDHLMANLMEGKKAQQKSEQKNNAPTPAATAPAATPTIAPVATRESAPVTVSRKPNSTATQPVKAPIASYNGTSQQTEMLAYINAARAQVNLAPLALNSKLSSAAYLKSQDMAVNAYFSHTSPTYGSPFAMMSSLGITYQTAGENIAQNFSVQGAHEAFMNSPGHRANILNPAFNKVGLGFYQSGDYLYVTQWFTN